MYTNGLIIYLWVRLGIKVYCCLPTCYFGWWADILTCVLYRVISCLNTVRLKGSVLLWRVNLLRCHGQQGYKLVTLVLKCMYCCLIRISSINGPLNPGFWSSSTLFHVLKVCNGQSFQSAALKCFPASVLPFQFNHYVCGLVPVDDLHSFWLFVFCSVCVQLARFHVLFVLWCLVRKLFCCCL